MTYFPTDVMKMILSYCDDTIERKQKKHHLKCVKKINRLKKDWYGDYLEANYSLWEMSETYNPYIDGERETTLDEQALWFSLMIEDRGFDDAEDLKDAITCPTLLNILYDQPYPPEGWYFVKPGQGVWVDYEGWVDMDTMFYRNALA